MSIVPSFLGGRSSVFVPFHGLPLSAQTAAMADTRVDWKETPEAHVFKHDLPGLKEEVKVKVEVEEGKVAQISGERSAEKEEKDKWHRVERSSGKFLRRFGLPENAKVDEVKAAMEDGGAQCDCAQGGGEEATKMKAIEISG